MVGLGVLRVPQRAPAQQLRQPLRAQRLRERGEQGQQEPGRRLPPARHGAAI